MRWEVKFDDLFEPEFDQLAESVQDEIMARARYWSSSDLNSDAHK
jgi:hypothetical protein